MAQPMRRRLRVAAGALHDRLQDVIDAPLRNREHPIRAEASPRMASSEFVRLERRNISMMMRRGWYF